MSTNGLERTQGDAVASLRSAGRGGGSCYCPDAVHQYAGIFASIEMLLHVVKVNFLSEVFVTTLVFIAV